MTSIRRQRRGAAWWLIRVFAVAFTSFVVWSLSIGGDALNGHAGDGRYFVAQHGTVTEVGRTVFIGNWVLGAVTIASFVFAIVAAAWERRHVAPKTSNDDLLRALLLIVVFAIVVVAMINYPRIAGLIG